MNNYSWLQQILHKLALSSDFMRTVSFDVENLLSSQTEGSDNHVFITGLARSGSTILLNALYESKIFSSLLYKDMPFVLAPNLWSKLSFINKDIDLVERSHGDGIEISLESPEAFEEVFWKTYKDKKDDSLEKFHTYINLINTKNKKNRYLSKNNQNINRIELINRILPKSKILILYRDPIQQSNSLLTQHKRFIKASEKDKFISNYMNLIGHTEFGPNYTPINKKEIKFDDNFELNHWIEQWYLTYRNCFNAFRGNKNIHFVCYEDLCGSKDYWIKILKMLNIEIIYDFNFKESRNEIDSRLDNDLVNKALDIYSKLSSA